MSSPLSFAVLIGSLGAGVGVGVGLAGGCAATGVTLHSNHYRVFVPPGWQVVEAGGGAELPALLRVPADDGAPTVDLRIYAWLIEAEPPDPSGDALRRLAAEDVVGLASAHADDTCAERADGFVVFGKPARAIHQQNGAGQRIVVTGGAAWGSLVAILATAPSGSSCAGLEAMDLALKRLVSTLAGNADALNPHPPPMILQQPLLEGPPVDIPSIAPPPGP